MADSFELFRVPNNPVIDAENLQPLRDWIFLVSKELEKRTLQSVDKKMNVVGGEIFVNDLPTSGSGTTGTLWNDSGTVKIVL